MTAIQEAPKSLSPKEKVTEYIKKKIVLKELRAGDKVPGELELCQMLNVSRGSVREAMKILESMNIVQIRRGDGTYISDAGSVHVAEAMVFKAILSDISLQQVVEYREQIEFAVLQMAAKNITEDELEALKNNIETTTKLLQEGTYQYNTLLQLDLDFHAMIGKATHNILMEEICNLTYEIAAPMMHNNYKNKLVDHTLQSHGLLYKALLERDMFTMVEAVKLSVHLWTESYHILGNKKYSSANKELNTWMLKDE